MAPRKSQEQEAIEAGERNVIPGQSWVEALIRGIGREMRGADMGTPFGQAIREEIGSLPYEQMLREQYPEEFSRGRLYGSEAFPTDLASLYAARPGRSTFTQIAGREARPSGSSRAIGGAGTPALNYEPVAAAPKGSFDASMMEAYRRGAAGSRPPGRPQAFRPEDFLAIEQGPLPTSRNAFEGNMVMAQRRGMPSPAPAAYDYEGAAGPGPFIDRPVSGFERNAVNAMQGARPVPGRQGTFGVEDFGGYTPEEMGQAMVPYRPQTMTQPQGQPPGGLAVMEEQKLPSYRYVGTEADRFPRGEYQAPYGSYGEFRDVTGDLLGGPKVAPYEGSMDFGVTREGAKESAKGLSPQMKKVIQAAAIAAGGGLGYGVLSGRDDKNALQNIDYRGFGLGYGPNMATPRMSEMYPVEQMPPAARREMGPPMAEGAARSSMEMLPPVTVGGKGKTAAKSSAGKGAAKTSGANVPLPPKRPEEYNWQGNFNYQVTQAIDRLLGQDEANRGRDYQQYYANNPWPY